MRTAERPIGLGRCGERVAKTPTFRSARGGRTFAFHPRACSTLRWNTKSTQMYSQPASPSRAWS